MIDDQIPSDLLLPVWCALLRWFDPPLLHALAQPSPADLSALLVSDTVVPATRPAGAYCLCEAARVRTLARLRATSPLAELSLHTRAFHFFLGRMEQPPSDRRALDEECCLYHLGALRDLLIERMDWRTITTYVAAVRAVTPQEPRTLRWLDFYDAYAAIRTQDYDRGEPILLDLALQPELDPALRVRVLHALGHTHWFQSRYDRALALYRQAHLLARENGDLFHQGYTLLNMGMIYNDLEQHDQALDLSSQSLSLFRELGNPYREAHALYEIGNNAMYLGRWQMAQEYVQEAIALYAALDMPPRLRMSYWMQGFLYHLLGDEQQSEAAYLRALTLAETAEHGDPRILMDTCVYLGLLYQTQGRWAEALAAYQQASSWATLLRNWHTLSLIHYRRGNVYSRQGDPEAALDAYRDAIEVIEQLRGDTEDETVKIGILGTTQQVYEAMVLLCLACDRRAEAFAYVERARSRAFLDTLTRKSPELYDAVDQPIVTLAEIQRHLPASALLIEYFTTGVIPRGEHLLNKLPAANVHLREHLTLPPQVIIFAIAHDRLDVQFAALDPNTLRPLPNDPGPGRRLLRGRMLPLLYERLIEPVAPLMQGRDLLYLIPHGPLHYVPFQALRSASGSYLLDEGGPMLARAPSATVLLRNCLSRRRSRAEHLIALGYNDTGDAELRHAEAEARMVAHLMGGEAWAGPLPKSRALLTLGPQIRWLHFAGHAVFKPRDPLASELRLGPDDALDARTIIGELELGADLVTLSACTSGLSQVVSGDELLGLQRAFLYAGVPSVVCTLWEAEDLVTRFVMERFYTDVRHGRPVAAALRDAQVFVRELTGRAAAAIVERWRAEPTADDVTLDQVLLLLAEQPDAQLFADPMYWAPFMLIGRPY
ncbi:MAG TPA: CHAT domain-containing tetratricopeptide repeat protein [Herpetosiphonaceae bacterium]